ncbi:MAG: hypothetical protein ACUVTX_04235 [Bacteroidales bacterium]
MSEDLYILLKMKRIALFYLLALMIISCKTQELYLNVIEPAPVSFPQEVRRAGITDRSETTKEAKALDVFDNILTLEGVELDRAGAEASLKGLAEIKGSLPIAIEWAKKTYEEYNLTRAIRYLKILENRIRKDELVQYQE